MARNATAAEATNGAGAAGRRRDHAPPATRLPCFVAGTRIMTSRGEVAVEALQPGALLVTLGLGGPWLAPLRWLGRRTLECRRLPETARPVRVRAGMLGPGIPHRDLLVSPDHGLYLEGALVAAGALVDGRAILREAAAERVAYLHVELDRHDVVLAEGAPAESWRDDGTRAVFANAGTLVRLRPDLPAGPAVGACAPWLVEADMLARIRARIARRAAAGGDGTGRARRG